MENKEGSIKGREKFSGYSKEFILRTLGYYKRTGGEAFEKGDLSLYFSIAKMEIDFLNIVLNNKTSN